jgi:hypothetical protein
MKNLIYAVVATCVAMLATSGIVIYATAATAPSNTSGAEASQLVTAEVDTAIAQQLLAVRARLRLPGAPGQ